MTPLLAVPSFLLLLVAAPPAESPKPAAKPYLVPYRLTNTNHVLVRAKINGKGPYNFILDTGAPALFVVPAVCEKLGIKADKSTWGRIDSFELEGRVPLKDVRVRVEKPFQLEGMNGLGLAGVELHGIIGYPVLARFRIEFDFTKQKMSWLPLQFQPPDPHPLGASANPPGMDVMVSVLKVLGGLLGKQAEAPVILRGFWGVVLEDGADGVVVKTLLDGGPAATAGLQPGDRIVKIAANNVKNLDALQKQAAKSAADADLELSIVRGGANRTIHLRTIKGL